MTFSILYPAADRQPERRDPPDFFVDLNLDQILDAIVEGKDEYELRPFYYSALRDAEAVRYRHDVFRDLENAQLLERVRALGRRLSEMRAHLAQAGKIRHRHESNAWFVEAVAMYCDAVRRLCDDLATLSPGARGITALKDYLKDYIASDRFRALTGELQRVQAALAAIRYAILIREGAFTVRRYDDEPDYSAEVEATFEKFEQAAAKDYRAKFSSAFPDMNHIEQQVLTFVAQLYPAEFTELDDFCRRNREYLDATIARFDREVQFYLSYVDYIASLRDGGLRFCYPDLSSGRDKAIRSRDGFDVALARKLVERETPVVTNDFSLEGTERMLVVSGPNQGGKTTFARAFGQMHYLAALGCPVPGSEARLYLFDRLFTQFEREESIENLRGKLEDDLHRLHDVIEAATGSSIVVLNEIFNSTTVRDAIFLSKQIMERLLDRDVIGVWVTFIDEIASLNEKTVSMVSTVNPENLAERTFKIVRRPADGLAYALAIAEKHRVTYRALVERIP